MRLGSGQPAFRRILVALIAVGAATALAALPGHVLALPAAPIAVLWALPPAAGGVLVAAALVAISAPPDLPVGRERRRLQPSVLRRAAANGLVWAGIVILAVGFTARAFDVVPGGAAGAAVLLAGTLGPLTARLHAAALDHEGYRTFNLVAMLLAVGALASMATTRSGPWWTINFSTLGTTDDFAAACFNVAIVVSGLGMAGLAPALTTDLLDERFSPRPGAAPVLRILIAVIGLSLVGVGLVPIDTEPDLHNAFACSAAAGFALATLGIGWWIRRLPRRFLVWSYASLAVETVALVAYDRLGLFNLTVFEIVAFSLVFAWLIAMVAMSTPPRPGRRRRPGRRPRRDTAPHRMPRRAHARPPRRQAAPVSARGPGRSRRRGIRSRAVRRPVPRSGGEDPPHPRAWVPRQDDAARWMDRRAERRGNR